MLNLLAFDLGGSSGKLLQGNFNGRDISLSLIEKFENRSVQINGALYWDIITVYQALLDGIKKAAASSNLHSLGIDSFSNDFALIDKNGELLSPVRCYRDDRTIRFADYIYNRVSPRRLYELTGNQNARFNTLMQIGAMQGTGQGWLLDHADRLLFVPNLLLFLLTGTIGAEYTIASVSQLFSFYDEDFSRELLDIFSLNKELFGPVLKSGSNAGTITKRLCAENSILPFSVVSVCEHDTASAYCASPFQGKNHIIISSGTWALMGCELDKPLINEEGYRYNFANEGGYPGHHRFLRNVMGSWIIQQIRSFNLEHGKNYSYAEMEKEAETSTPFAYFIDVDDDLFFSPGNMPGKIHDYCMAHYSSAPANTGALVRCVYESLAMKYRRNLELLRHITNKSFSFITIIGGGARDKLMCQFTADACNLPVAAGPEEATALGNIIVQLIAAGEITNLEEGRKIIADSFPVLRYEPNDNAVWEEQYRKYCELIPI